MNYSCLNFQAPPKPKPQPKLKMLRSEVVSHVFRTDNGGRFSFEGREYLKDIYDIIHRDLVLVASRQAEKSTFLSKDLLLELFFTDNERLLFVSSGLDQIKEIVSVKIDSQMQFNPNLKRFMYGKSSRNNAKEKLFGNGSRVSFRAIGNRSTAVRGISVRKIYFDEVQDMNAEGIAITKECASHYSDSSAYFYAGTPFSSRNVLSRMYKDTCQNEWIIRCSKCEKDNPPLGIEHIDIDKPYLFCYHCGEEMMSSDGRWVPQNPASKKTGYRICRLMTPNCVWRSEAHDGVLDKFESYPEAQFFQEVLGLPFDRGNLPITEDEIYANCGDYSFLSFDRLVEHRNKGAAFGAIDWAWSDVEGGRAYTIFSAAQYNGNKIEIIYAKRFYGNKYHNPDVVLNEIVDLALQLNLKGIATDHGIGHKENLRLRDHLLRKQRTEIQVFEMLYVTSKKEQEWNSVTKLFNIGRTVTLDLVFHRLKKGLYQFPRKEDIQPFAEDILNVQIAYDPNFKSVTYDHAGTGPDDFLHLLNYLSIVIEMYHSKIIR